MAKTKHGLPQTKGFFKLRGLATGLERENAFKTNTYDSGSQRNTLNFGIQTNEHSSVYVQIDGYRNNDVYLFKQSEVKGQKSEQKIVKWEKRYAHESEGFVPIGISLGLAKDEEGKNMISNNILPFDAAKDAHDMLKDETPIFATGEIEFSSFKNKDGDKVRNRRFNVTKLYGSKSVDFESEDFKETADFKQKIIFVGISKDTESKEPKFLVEVKIVSRNSIEDAEFVIYNNSLANQFKKSLKPYTALDVWGNIYNKLIVDEVVEVDVWGQEDSFKRGGKKYDKEMVITGADPSTIDEDTYTEEIIDSAVSKLKSEGQVDKGSWGSSNKVEVNDEDLPW